MPYVLNQPLIRNGFAKGITIHVTACVIRPFIASVMYNMIYQTFSVTNSFQNRSRMMQSPSRIASSSLLPDVLRLATCASKMGASYYGILICNNFSEFQPGTTPRKSSHLNSRSSLAHLHLSEDRRMKECHKLSTKKTHLVHPLKFTTKESPTKSQVKN